MQPHLDAPSAAMETAAHTALSLLSHGSHMVRTKFPVAMKGESPALQCSEVNLRSIWKLEFRSEYEVHSSCLNPALMRVVQGNWTLCRAKVVNEQGDRNSGVPQ